MGASMPKRTIHEGDCNVRESAKDRLWMVDDIFKYSHIPAHVPLRKRRSNRVAPFALTGGA